MTENENIDIPKWANNHSGIVISRNIKEWSKKVNARLIHRELTDEIALRIIMLQRYKIGKNPDNNDKLTIIFHNCELEDFKLHPKLYIYLKYHNEALNIETVELDNIPSFPIWNDLHFKLEYSKNIYSKLKDSELTGHNTTEGRKDGNTEAEAESH